MFWATRTHGAPGTVSAAAVAPLALASSRQPTSRAPTRRCGSLLRSEGCSEFMLEALLLFFAKKAPAGGTG